MKAAFYGFLLGVLTGAGGYWYLTAPENAEQIAAAKEQIREGAETVKDSVAEQFEKISTEKIKEEMSKTGTVVVEKAKDAGRAIADVTIDTKTTATIKAKFAKSGGVSASNIKVSTTDGLVTLSGTAATAEEIRLAIALALETTDVRKVISTIELVPDPGSK